MNAKALYSIFLFLCTCFTWAQVSFVTKVSRDKIGINETVEVSFVMNVDGDHLTPPEFTNFQVVGGPMQSFSSSWVNGKSSKTISVGFFIQPTKQGKLTIGSATMTYEGKVYKTQPVTIEVGEPVQRTQPQNPHHRSRTAQSFWDEFFGNPEPQQTPQLPKNLGEGVHVVAHINKKSAYINEPITVEYRLYVSHYNAVNHIQLLNMPKFTNFWNHVIENTQQQVLEGIYKGKEYRYIVLQKGVLLPQKDGDLTIDPMELEMLVETPTGRYDIFGRPEMKRELKKYSSGTHTIKVRPLPIDNQPESFLGAVGSFTLDKQVNKTQVKANEALELTITVKGKGNLQLIDIPKPIAPVALEVYEPQIIDKISNNLSVGMQGSRTYKYTIVPQYKGKYTIEPIEFSYFDIESKTYKTLTTEPTVIDVTEGPDLPTNTIKKNESITPNKFQINHPTLANAKGSAVTWLENIPFITSVILPLLMIPFVVLFAKIKEAKSANTLNNQSRRLNKLVKKYLSTAKKQLGNKEVFYELLEKSLHNYIRAVLYIETKDMSNDKIKEILLDKGIAEETIIDFMKIKANCEMARYAQFTASDQEVDYQLAIQVIQSIDKQLKDNK